MWLLKECITHARYATPLCTQCDKCSCASAQTWSFTVYNLRHVLAKKHKLLLMFFDKAILKKLPGDTSSKPLLIKIHVLSKCIHWADAFLRETSSTVLSISFQANLIEAANMSVTIIHVLRSITERLPNRACHQSHLRCFAYFVWTVSPGSVASVFYSRNCAMCLSLSHWANPMISKMLDNHTLRWAQNWCLCSVNSLTCHCVLRVRAYSWYQ